jgi:hypothetical protein
MSEGVISSNDFERVAIHAARERWCCAWPCTTCGAGPIRSAYAKMGSLPDDLTQLKIEGPEYFTKRFEFTGAHYEAMKEADFERIMREAKIKSWKDPVRIFGVLAYRYENKEQVEQTLRKKLDAVRELEQDFLDELMIREMYPNVAEFADAMDIPIKDALPDFRR